MPSNKTLSLTNLGRDELILLINGLVSLEGALKALEKPLPESLDQLKATLYHRIGTLATLKKDTMTTQEVADFLHCTNRNVLMLGKKGKIELARAGAQGRGLSNLYYTESVREYFQLKS